MLAMLFIFGCSNEPKPVAEETAQAANPTSTVAPEVQDLFEEQNPVKMHFFGTNDAPPKEDYPYTGKEIGEAQMKFLADDLQPNEVGSVYACYRTEYEGFYILRVPGKYASSNLSLAKWDASSSKLIKVQDLATIQCDEGMCIQQDAWLTDLDDNRISELVVRRQTNDNGKISDESFQVYAQEVPGSFSPAKPELAALAPQTSYVLNKF